ncbi:hypothetical protein ACFWVM_28860 [Nocardia fluminea]|uniref:hypothetical protein n=1 Tax=Nocardia fluminea TaxID=134984 RepID=UPI0036473398
MNPHHPSIPLSKAADIPDVVLLTIIQLINGRNGSWATLGEVVTDLTHYGFDAVARPDEQRPYPVPHKLALAKLRRLHAKGWIDGCTCGCYGGFYLTKYGVARMHPPSAVKRTPQRRNSKPPAGYLLGFQDALGRQFMEQLPAPFLTRTEIGLEAQIAREAMPEINWDGYALYPVKDL